MAIEAVEGFNTEYDSISSFFQRLHSHQTLAVLRTTIIGRKLKFPILRHPQCAGTLVCGPNGGFSNIISGIDSMWNVQNELRPDAVTDLLDRCKELD